MSCQIRVVILCCISFLYLKTSNFMSTFSVTKLIWNIFQYFFIFKLFYLLQKWLHFFYPSHYPIFSYGIDSFPSIFYEKDFDLKWKGAKIQVSTPQIHIFIYHIISLSSFNKLLFISISSLVSLAIGLALIITIYFMA